MIPKFALLSPVLPPAPSGQAVMLHRLLEGIPPERYCLITWKNHFWKGSRLKATERLPAKHYYLNPATQIHNPPRFIGTAINLSLDHLGVLSQARQLAGIIREEGCRALIACTAQHQGLPAAWIAAGVAGVPLVPYIFDDYFYQFRGYSYFLYRALWPHILRSAKGVIVTNEFMREAYRKRYGVESVVLHNPCIAPDPEKLDSPGKVFEEKTVNIVYTGAIYEAHYDAFLNIIQVIRMLNRPNVRLHLYSPEQRRKLERSGIQGPMVVFHEHMSAFDIPNVLRQADILFLPLAFDSPYPEIIKTSLPGKTGEYLSVGRPVLVHAPACTFISWYFRKHRCGVVVDRNDPAALARAIENIIEDRQLQAELGRRALERAREDFDVEKVRPKFIRFLNSLS